MSKRIPAAVREHYLTAPQPHQATMLEMRERILQIVPKVEEVVSYGMPAFKVDGNIVAGLLANKNHVGYYPFSGSVLHLFEKELAKFSITKSAIHVPVDKPLSKALMVKLIKARISQCPIKQGKVDLAKYEKHDGFWRELGIAAPARRGLVDARLFKLEDLAKISESKFLEIHGIGPRVTKLIKGEMRRRKLEFK